ncbi:TPA: polysaccharide pyruvyl transferase family protein [Enterococcus faecium]
MMKVLLVGFIDSSNIGDRLITETLSQLLLTETEVKKYSYKFINESQIEINNNVKQRSKLYEIYFKYIRHLPLVKIIVSKVKWGISQKKKYVSSNIQQFEQSLKEADLLFIAGGNAIFDLSPATLSATRFNRIVSLAKKHKVPIFANSIGIGPFSTSKQKDAALDALNKCDYITFRDQRW